MPNQYNVRDLTNVPADSSTTNLSDGYPIPSASGYGGSGATGVSVSVASTGVFPTSADTAWTIIFQQDAAATPDSQTRNVQPSASGYGGGNAVKLTTAFDGGTGANKVVDFIDAPFNLNENMWASGISV